METLDQFKSEEQRDPQPRQGQPPTTLSNWTAPLGMAGSGTVVRGDPGADLDQVSFVAFVDLPPAYLATPRADLPVLVLIHGVPGEPSNWLRNGRIAQFMDDYASSHKGLVPIVVMPDAGGKGATYPPLCLNSSRARPERT